VYGHGTADIDRSQWSNGISYYDPVHAELGLDQLADILCLLQCADGGRVRMAISIAIR